MRRVAIVLVGVFSLAGCGGWGYDATAVHEQDGNRLKVEQHHPPECFVIDIHNEHGVLDLLTNKQSLGVYCHVPDPHYTPTTTSAP